jgi:hypothetical protein
MQLITPTVFPAQEQLVHLMIVYYYRYCVHNLYSTNFMKPNLSKGSLFLQKGERSGFSFQVALRIRMRMLNATPFSS